MEGLEARMLQPTLPTSITISDGSIEVKHNTLHITNTMYIEEMIQCLLDNGYKVMLQRSEQGEDEEGCDITICL